MRIRSPLLALGSADPIDLAGQLLDEIERGHVPVWPTTVRYAERLVHGLEALLETRGRDVVRAVALAPVGTPLDWPSRLKPLIT